MAVNIPPICDRWRWIRPSSPDEEDKHWNRYTYIIFLKLFNSFYLTLVISSSYRGKGQAEGHQVSKSSEGREGFNLF